MKKPARPIIGRGHSPAVSFIFVKTDLGFRFGVNPFLCLLCNDIDHAPRGIIPIDHRRRPSYHLNPLHYGEWNRRPVRACKIYLICAAAIHKHENILPARFPKAANIHTRPFGIIKDLGNHDPRPGFEEFGNGTGRRIFDIVPIDNRHAAGHIRERILRADDFENGNFGRHGTGGGLYFRFRIGRRRDYIRLFRCPLSVAR
ncbi:MAG: hypothetical protein BWY42_01291 [Candidatus Omnitrophica bacterium ADurb.Bin277]|nr:MAG: hypothetical protein BWY42_01291 [Candidatus Omnitrophica bacterium ADurb.Bin277]